MSEVNKELLLDLLCKQATEGLSAEEAAQLSKLEQEFPEFADDDSFEAAAAAISLLAVEDLEEMPAHLRSGILASSDAYIDSAQDSISVTEFSPERSPASVPAVESPAPKTSFWESLGWGVAAFACIALAVNLYLTRVQDSPDVAGGKTPVTQTPTPQLTDAEKREQLLASSKDVIKAEVSKADPKSPEEITGDIVWNSAEQKGYMRFKGLPKNDPQKSTYQLWIFDENQDEKYPIDGGVFDVNSDGEVIIPIDAKIDVKKPTLFAVTKEKPGGVVVSDRKGIVAIAKV